MFLRNRRDAGIQARNLTYLYIHAIVSWREPGNQVKLQWGRDGICLDPRLVMSHCLSRHINWSHTIWSPPALSRIHIGVFNFSDVITIPVIIVGSESELQSTDFPWSRCFHSLVHGNFYLANISVTIFLFFFCFTHLRFHCACANFKTALCNLRIVTTQVW